MKTTIFLIALLISQIALSQTIKKSSIDNGGASVSNNSIHMIYTIGEVNVREITAGSIGISEGFIGPNSLSSPENQPPVINKIVAPVDPIALGNSAIVEVYFTDNNLAEASIDWGDGSGIVFGDFSSQPITWEYTYLNTGVYLVTIKLVDIGGEITEEIYRYIVIYDPTAGFVTGGGWIFSPEGAYTPDLLLTGKASFGFVSKYKKGSTVPDGDTEFQFKAGNLNFKSTVYEWLVIASSKAIFKGSGTINGFGNYGFILSAIDAELTPSAVIDKFRIKIWDKDNNDVVVYDNNLVVDDNADPTTEIGGGSIIIHTGKTKSAEIESGLISQIENPNISVYPNPFDKVLHFEFVSPIDIHACIDIFDVTGRKVKTVFTGPVEGNVNYRAEFVPVSTVSSMYFYKMKLGEEVFYGKVVFNKR